MHSTISLSTVDFNRFKNVNNGLSKKSWHYFFSHWKCFAWLHGNGNYLLQNKCGFNDTPTWPAWPFFGDDHVIWMSPVMVKSSKVTSIPWLLFCESSFVINQLKYACVLLPWPHQEATNISSILDTYQKRREAQVSAQDWPRRIYTERATQWWRWRVRLRRERWSYVIITWWLMCQQDTQNRRASERKAEEVYRAEVTVRGSRPPEVA